MGCTASKAAPGAEVVVAAHTSGKAISPHFEPVGKAVSEAGSDEKSATLGSLTDFGGSSLGSSLGAFDTRSFEIERKRQGAVQALGVVDTPIDDPRFNAITKLMSSIFQTPVALITLITEDRVWFKSKVGPFGACVSREGSWCNYISVPNAPEVLITEDASEDARFAANPYVAGAPFIKFYAGAPLVGKNGMRYGTLCIVDLKRRAFSAEMYALLVNFANLVVQELERDSSSMREVQGEANAVADGQQRIEALMAASTASVALVDVRSRAWPVLYANESFARDEGGSVEDCTAAGLWDLFDPAGREGKAKAMKRIDSAVVAGTPARITVASKRTGRQVSVVLRPASTDQLSPSKAVGIPNWVPSEKAPQMGCHAGALPGALEAGGGEFEGPVGTGGSGHPQLANCFWFVQVEGSAVSSAASSAATSAGSSVAPSVGAPRTPGATPPGTRSNSIDVGGNKEARLRRSSTELPLHLFSSKPLPAVLEGLQMGPMIGSGSFGRVYRGQWRDRVVAVKIIDCTLGGGKQNGTSAAEVALHEAELSRNLDHPCIVKTLEYAMLGGAFEGSTLWMVQQMCNHGTLIEAVDRGWLRKKRSLTAPPSLTSVLRTLREVAAGMAYLHSQDVLHCDLTGNNVLLEAADGDERGYRALVSDFGLARVVAGEVTTSTFGTCSHMAPELMTEGILGKAADVWSFGVIAWEMYSGVRAYVGFRMPNIIFLVTSGKGQLKLPESAPAGYRALVDWCLQRDHTQRPSFEQLVARIDELLTVGEDATEALQPPPLHMGPCKAAAIGCQMAAAAAAVAPEVGTPPQNHT